MKVYKTSRVMSADEFNEFQSEMNRLSSIKWNGYGNTLRQIGISYLGSINVSAKLRHNFSVNTLVYGVYLASADNCGLEVCGKYSVNCRASCLVNSGQAKVQGMADKKDIFRSRNTRTRLFFANRKVFCLLLHHEIEHLINRGKAVGMNVAVRFNCTSNINLETIKFANGNNLLQEFPNLSFYDYTKNFNDVRRMEKYPNYYCVFSRDGSEENEKNCRKVLSMGYSIAVVFETTDENKLPKTYMGHQVINGQEYDVRTLDPKNCVVGLTYKLTKNDYEDIGGKHIFKGIPKIPFIVPLQDHECD